MFLPRPWFASASIVAGAGDVLVPNPGIKQGDQANSRSESCESWVVADHAARVIKHAGSLSAQSSQVIILADVGDVVLRMRAT